MIQWDELVTRQRKTICHLILFVFNRVYKVIYSCRLITSSLIQWLFFQQDLHPSKVKTMWPSFVWASLTYGSQSQYDHHHRPLIMAHQH